MSLDLNKMRRELIFPILISPFNFTLTFKVKVAFVAKWKLGRSLVYSIVELFSVTGVGVHSICIHNVHCLSF